MRDLPRAFRVHKFSASSVWSSALGTEVVPSTGVTMFSGMTVEVELFRPLRDHIWGKYPGSGIVLKKGVLYFELMVFGQTKGWCMYRANGQTVEASENPGSEEPNADSNIDAASTTDRPNGNGSPGGGTSGSEKDNNTMSTTTGGSG